MEHSTLYIGRQSGLKYTLLRALGVRSIERGSRRGTEVRASWFELTLSRGYWTCFATGLSLIDWGTDRDPDENRYSVNLKLPGLNLFVKMPTWFWPSRPVSDRDFMHGSVGLEFQSVDTEFPSELVVSSFSGTVARIEMPWALVFHRRSDLLEDGSWHHEYDRDRLGVHRARHARRNRWRALVGLPALPDPRADETWQTVEAVKAERAPATEAHPYVYVLRSGEVQERTATVTVREMEWRRFWLRWTPLLVLVRQTIEVQFSGEVGERSGSWKGGCVGCSYEMRPGETPEQCLRRMERDRKF